MTCWRYQYNDMPGTITQSETHWKSVSYSQCEHFTELCSAHSKSQNAKDIAMLTTVLRAWIQSFMISQSFILGSSGLEFPYVTLINFHIGVIDEVDGVVLSERFKISSGNEKARFTCNRLFSIIRDRISLSLGIYRGRFYDIGIEPLSPRRTSPSLPFTTPLWKGKSIRLVKSLRKELTSLIPNHNNAGRLVNEVHVSDSSFLRWHELYTMESKLVLQKNNRVIGPILI